ncbi:vgr related protein [uncultured Sphingomonas sp.]|uniref:vgr related protein n=1 Tax=uncultured Sphingomonas sp. TaxID=158754 RepID=UPI0035CA9129
MNARRPLTPGETDLARSVFGDTVDYSRVTLSRTKWAFFQPRRVVMAPLGCIHFHPKGDLWREDFAAAPLGDQGLFIHEMTHVWQHQCGACLPLARHPFCRYGYVLKPGRPFSRYGLEQQAEIVRHVFLLRNGATVAAAPALAQYETLMPFRPR